MKFIETEKSINQDVIEKLEELFGYKLPKEYITHLLKYNGGRCEPNIFSFKENGKLSSSNVDWFLALYGGENDNMFSYLKDFKDVLPKYFLPIAHDSGGNLICISCRDEDFGTIYFWNHEYNKLNINEVWIIASSFNEFLMNLK